jgi:tRNA(Ile)-lysidine synthase
MAAMTQSEPLLQAVAAFLESYLDPARPVLLGLSGGADSTALFFALLRCGVRLHVAHIDHGWREESADEAAALRLLVTRHSDAPFHSLRLISSSGAGNREEGARKVRMGFFRQVCRDTGCQAVALAHHADDLAETTFKRIFDSASLDKLGGLKAVQKMEGLTFWRPLLSLRKQTLVDWLSHQNIPFFVDLTNGPDYCLRGRLRSRLFPQLSRDLGRSIHSPLVRLSERAHELSDFLDSLTTPLLGKVRRGPLGLWLDAGEAREWHPFLLRYLVRRFAALSDLVLSAESIAVAARLLARGEVGAVGRNQKELHLDRGRLFFCPLNLNNYETVDVQMGILIIGPWKALITKTAPPRWGGGWTDLWERMSWQALPLGEYTLATPIMGSPSPRGQSLSRHYNKQQVPTFLRNRVPVICSQGKIVADFLTANPPAKGGIDDSKNMGQTDMIFVGVSVSGIGLGEHVNRSEL